MKYSFIQFRFIKNLPHGLDKSDDDIVEIKSNGDDFLWVFRDHCPTGQVVWLSREDIFKKFDGMMDLLKYDHAPYRSMQVFLPGFPTVLINLQDVWEEGTSANKLYTECLDCLRTMMNNVFDSWPENMCRNHIRDEDPDDVYDEGETEANDSEESEESEAEAENPYKDMPPLISNRPNYYQAKYSYNPSTPVRVKTEPVCPPAPGRGLGLMRKAQNTVIDLTEEDSGPVTRSKAKKAKHTDAPVHSYWQ